MAKINSVPFRWARDDDDLPDRGWDAVLQAAFEENDAGVAPTATSLIEATVRPDLLGSGLSREILGAVKKNAVRLGSADLVGPVRPTRKSLEPWIPMRDYLARSRPDHLPDDPWLRTHVRLGARVVKVCSLSMTISGTLIQWRLWTGLPLDRSGPVEVPGALTPVVVSIEHDHAVYIEPNVWMHYPLANAR